MTTFDLGLVDGDDWGATSVDAVELAINTRGVDALTTTQRLALSGANRPTPRVVFDTTLARWFFWDGTVWRGVTPIIGGALLSDTGPTTANVWKDMPSTQTISANPSAPITVTATLTARCANFTDIQRMFIRIGISIDGGATWTYGNEPSVVFGQGGNNYNNATLSAGHFRSGTPTGSVQVKGQMRQEVGLTGGIQVPVLTWNAI